MSAPRWDSQKFLTCNTEQLKKRRLRRYHGTGIVSRVGHARRAERVAGDLVNRNRVVTEIADVHEAAGGIPVSTGAML